MNLVGHWVQVGHLVQEALKVLQLQHLLLLQDQMYQKDLLLLQAQSGPYLRKLLWGQNFQTVQQDH